MAWMMNLHVMENPNSTPWGIAAEVFGERVGRPSPIVLATTSTQQLFLACGPVMLTGLIGVVTTVFDAAASLLRFWIGTSGSTDICAASATLASAAVGTVAYITGVFCTACQICKTMIILPFLHGDPFTATVGYSRSFVFVGS